MARPEPHKQTDFLMRHSRRNWSEKYVTSRHGDSSADVFSSEAQFQTIANQLADKVLPIRILFDSDENPQYPDWYDGHASLTVSETVAESTDHNGEEEPAGKKRKVTKSKLRVNSVRHNFLENKPIYFKNKMQFLRAPYSSFYEHELPSPTDKKQTFTLSAGAPWDRNEQLSLSPPPAQPKSAWLSERVMETAKTRPAEDDAVGILVRRHWDLVDEDIGDITMNQDEKEKNYGKKNQTALLTGRVTKVHDDVVEYNINTYQGCSGAPLVYLTGPEAGKVIGSHCGANEGNFNFAFFTPELSVTNSLDVEE